MRLGNVGLRAKIMSCNLIPAAMLIVLSVLVGLEVNNLLKSVSRVDLTYEAVIKGRQIRQRASDMETAVRGYLLTGDESHLDLYAEAKRQIYATFEDAKKEVSNNPVASKHLSDAEVVITQWQSSVARPEINLRKQIGSGTDVRDLARLAARGMDEEYFDRFRKLMRQFIENERAHFADAVGRQTEQVEKAAAEIDLNKLRDAIVEVNHTNADTIKGQDIVLLADDMQRAMRGFLLTGEEDFLQPYSAAQNEVFGSIDRLRMIRSQFKGEEKQIKLLNDMEATLRQWIEKVSEPQIALRRQINMSKTMEDLAQLVAAVGGKAYTDRFRELLRSFEKEELRQLNERQDEAATMAGLTKKAVVLGTIVVIVISLVAAYLVAGAMTRPLARALEFAEAVTRGDLTGQLKVKNRDEVGRLTEALNVMVNSLRNQTRRILEGVNVLASAATEISSTVSQVVSGTTQTSAAVSETTATVEQVKQSALTSKERAMSVSESSRKAVEISEEGRKATENTVYRMNVIKDQMESIGETVVKLSEHSVAIEDIIGTVQDIADQSNLLAVNASIEAARAGDHGKGFAVVAHEIKNLADQSKEATDHVRSILEDTRKWVSAVVMATEQGGKAVEAGVEQSLSAGEAIQALADGVAEAAQVAGIIQTASDQQVQGVEQVAGAMVSINTAVQQNVSGSTQLEDMSKQISEVGGSLRDMVNRYRV